MKIRIVSVDLLSFIFPGIIACILFLPLIPNTFRGVLLEGNDGWQIVLILSIAMWAIILTIFSMLIEVALGYIGKSFRVSCEHQPTWLIEAVLQRVEEFFEIDVSKLQRVNDTGELKKSESTNLFYLILVFVSERAKFLESSSYRSLKNLFKNLLTVFALATIIYPIVQPYPLFASFGPNFGQRLIISAICGTLAIICFLKAREFHSAFQRDVINRFMALPKEAKT